MQLRSRTLGSRSSCCRVKPCSAQHSSNHSPAAQPALTAVQLASYPLHTLQQAAGIEHAQALVTSLKEHGAVLIELPQLEAQWAQLHQLGSQLAHTPLSVRQAAEDPDSVYHLGGWEL